MYKKNHAVELIKLSHGVCLGWPVGLDLVVGEVGQSPKFSKPKNILYKQIEYALCRDRI